MSSKVNKFREIEGTLRETLRTIYCPLCGYFIVGYDGDWSYRHIPIVKIDSNGCIEAGYYCGAKGQEFIIYRDCSNSTGTRIMEG